MGAFKAMLGQPTATLEISEARNQKKLVKLLTEGKAPPMTGHRYPSFRMKVGGKDFSFPNGECLRKVDCSKGIFVAFKNYPP